MDARAGDVPPRSGEISIAQPGLLEDAPLPLLLHGAALMRSGPRLRATCCIGKRQPLLS